MIRKFISDEKGSAITEFALTLPLVVLLVFGYIFYMNGVETHIIMQTAAREGARAYANPIYGVDMKSYAMAVSDRELEENNIKGSNITAYAEGLDRIVKIEKPYSTRFPLKNFTLKAYSVFHSEPYDQ